MGVIVQVVHTKFSSQRIFIKNQNLSYLESEN
jgi:hypothetical protein